VKEAEVPEEEKAPAPEHPAAALVRTRFPEALLEEVEFRGETTLVLAPAAIADVCLALRDASDLRFNFLADITAVDWPEREPRFDVVYHLLSLETRSVVRLKVRVGEPDEDEPQVPSVTSVWPTANWYEREIYDLFGIAFTGHPDLRRILMPTDWVGHPLRKDYPLTGITLPEPHWGGQVPFGAPLPSGTGQQTLRTPGGMPVPPAGGVEGELRTDAATEQARPLHHIDATEPVGE
jgi:NADH-quinone oxidoreductase subunit C